MHRVDFFFLPATRLESERLCLNDGIHRYRTGTAAANYECRRLRCPPSRSDIILLTRSALESGERFSSGIVSRPFVAALRQPHYFGRNVFV